MNNTGRMFLIALLSLGLTILALGQSQQPASQGPVSTQGSSIDNQGVRKYLIGPGDIRKREGQGQRRR